MKRKTVVKASRASSWKTYDVVSTATGKVMDIDAPSFDAAAREVASWSAHCEKGNIITVADRKGNSRSYEVVRKGAVRDVTGDTLDEKTRMGASMSVKSSTRPTKRKSTVQSAWISHGKKAKIRSTYKTDDNYMMFEVGDDFIGISVNNSWPNGEAWISTHVVTCDDAEALFNYVKDAMEQHPEWSVITALKKSGYKYKITSFPGMGSSDVTRRVGASTSTKRKSTIKASAKTDLTKKLSKLYNAYMAIDDDKALKRTGMTLAEYNALPDVFERLQKNGHVNTFMSGLANYFKKFGFSVSLDGTDYEITASSSTKRKFTVKASTDKSKNIEVHFNDGRKPARYTASVLEDMMTESNVDYIIDTETGELIYESEHGDVRGSKSVKCSDAIECARGYFADDLNNENDKKILSTLCESIKAKYDGKQIGNGGSISVIDVRETPVSYVFYVDFDFDGDLTLLRDGPDVTLHIEAPKSNRTHKFNVFKDADAQETLTIPISGCRPALEQIIDDILSANSDNIVTM